MAERPGPGWAARDAAAYQLMQHRWLAMLQQHETRLSRREAAQLQAAVAAAAAAAPPGASAEELADAALHMHLRLETLGHKVADLAEGEWEPSAEAHFLMSLVHQHAPTAAASTVLAALAMCDDRGLEAAHLLQQAEEHSKLWEELLQVRCLGGVQAARAPPPRCPPLLLTSSYPCIAGGHGGGGRRRGGGGGGAQPTRVPRHAPGRPHGGAGRGELA